MLSTDLFMIFNGVLNVVVELIRKWFICQLMESLVSLHLLQTNQSYEAIFRLSVKLCFYTCA